MHELTDSGSMSPKETGLQTFRPTNECYSGQRQGQITFPCPSCCTCDVAPLLPRRAA